MEKLLLCNDLLASPLPRTDNPKYFQPELTEIRQTA